MLRCCTFYVAFLLVSARHFSSVHIIFFSVGDCVTEEILSSQLEDYVTEEIELPRLDLWEDCVTEEIFLSQTFLWWN